MSEEWRPTAAIEVLQERAKLLARVREFFASRNVVEVQTSVLADHGVTDVNLQNIEVPGLGFLQTSPEFQMKRLLAAGFDSCYQICPAFRFGEAGRWHSVEFTMLEWYRVGMSLDDLVQELSDLVELFLGTAEMQSMTVGQLLHDAYGLDAYRVDKELCEQIAKKEGLLGENTTDDRLDFLIGVAINRLSYERVFLTNYPESMAALAKVESRGDIRVARRFEMIINGMEIANGYDELLDSAEMRRRAERENQQRKRRGMPEMVLDPNLVAAMEAGLPDCCGVAVGLDRLIALAVNASSIDQVQPFPLKPE